MKASEKAVYINQLATVAGISLDSVAPFAKDFAPLKDKKEINVQFFKVLETVKLSKQKNVSIPDITVKAKVNTSQIQKKLDTRIKKLGIVCAQLEEIQSEIIELRKFLKDPSEDLNLTEKIKEIDTSGFWSFIHQEKDFLVFETKNDVICQDLDELAKLKKNLGRYRATFNIKTCETKVYSLGRRQQDWIHPYVNHGGFICWGNATTIAQQQAREYRIDKLFKLLAGLLTTHAGGGFTHLSDPEY